MIALVRLVIFFWIDRGSILKSLLLMSAKTGVAPVCKMELEEAAKVSEGTITSSDALIPSARSARNNAVVPEEVAIECETPQYAEKDDSNSLVYFPSVSQPDEMASRICSRTSNDIFGFEFGMLCMVKALV